MKLFYILMLVHCNFALAKVLKFDGVAKNSKSEVVYTEKHEATFKNDKVEKSLTQYFSPEGKLIATLTSNYDKSIFLPDYTFLDLRNGMEHIVVLKDNKLFIEAKKSKDAPVEKQEIEITENMISGQGFHYFIRENIEKFSESKNKDVRFVMPGLLDFFTFNISKDRRPAGDDKDDVLHLKMSVNSVFLKLFVSTIKMQYSKLKKHLLMYDGVSNLVSEDGKNQSVVISYTY